MIDTHLRSSSIRRRTRLLARQWEGAELTRQAIALWRLIEEHAFITIGLLYTVIWCAFTLWHSVPFASIETDGMEYIQTARTLFTPNWVPSSFHGVGYPAAIWLVHVFVGDWFLSARVTSGIAGLALVLASLGLAETLLNRKTALVCGLLIVTNFFFIAYSAIAMSDMLPAALGVIGLLLLIRGSNPARYAAAAALIGLAAVTRYQYFGLIPAGVLIGLLEPTLAARLRGWAFFYVIFALAAAPMLVTNWQAIVNPLANSNFANLGGWFYSARQAHDVHSWGDAFGLIAGNPSYFALGYLKGVTFDLPAYLPHVFGFSMLLAPGGWALIIKRGENRKRVYAALAFFSLYVLVTGLSWLTEARFWLALLPFIGTGCAFLLVQLAANRRRIALALALVLVLGNATIAAANLPHYIQMQAPEFKRAGLAIRAVAPQDAVILVTQPQIAYYAERRAVVVRDVSQSLEALPGVLSENKIQYVVMDDRYGSIHYRELEELLEPVSLKQVFPSWTLVYNEEDSPRIAVYRVMTP